MSSFHSTTVARAGIFLLVLILTVSCGAKIDGLDAASTESAEMTTDFSPVVTVVLPNGRGLCTGTFISPKAVLTAAHCTLEAGAYRVITNWGIFTTSQREVLGAGTVEDDTDIALLLFASDVASRSEGQVYRASTDPSELEPVRLVGYGCNNLGTRRGTGIKRTGTNKIYRLTEWIELLTPPLADAASARGILGPKNRAGTCFGDSGSALLRPVANGFTVVGVSHAGGYSGEDIISQFTNLSRGANLTFLQSKDAEFTLNIFDCEDPDAGLGCSSSAIVGLLGFVKFVWSKLMLWVF